MKDYNFGEKVTEYSAKQRKEIPVWVSPKYTQSREKAIEIINKYDSIEPSDFWILMNETKSGKMAYSGLIISHNGCLKLNDAMPEDKKFVPSCMELDKDGYNGSLVFSYINNAQGLYEVGEVAKDNCKNSYPYAMALKRCFDRVVLKNSKLAYAGVYSDSEADEFAERIDAPKEGKEKKESTLTARDKVIAVAKEKGISMSELAKDYKLNASTTEERFEEVLKDLEGK